MAVYTGLLHIFIVQPGSQFRNTFAAIAASNSVDVQKTGVDAHSSLNIGERLENGSSIGLMHHLLFIAVNALIETLGPNGVVLSALVFGDYQSIRSFDKPRLPSLKLAERATSAQRARNLMTSHMANTKVTSTLKHNTPPAADLIYALGDRALVWRKRKL